MESEELKLLRENNRMLKYLISLIEGSAQNQYAKDFVINYLANIAADFH